MSSKKHGWTRKAWLAYKAAAQFFFDYHNMPEIRRAVSAMQDRED
jgi:hypothetical protein